MQILLATPVISLLLEVPLPHGKFSTRYNIRDGISSTVVNVPGFDGDVSLDPPYGVYISQLLSLED